MKYGDIKRVDRFLDEIKLRLSEIEEVISQLIGSGRVSDYIFKFSNAVNFISFHVKNNKLCLPEFTKPCNTVNYYMCYSLNSSSKLYLNPDNAVYSVCYSVLVVLCAFI